MVVIKHIKINIRVSIIEKRGYLEVLKLPHSSAFLAALLGAALLGGSKISQEMEQKNQSGAQLTH